MSFSFGPKEKYCRQFSLDVIREATNNFAESKVLGKGGEGKVYLADVYLHKAPVAVKLLLPNSVGFEDEIRIVSEIQHPNLVSLIGYCEESEHRILVYEYMANGRLSDYVGKKCDIYLSWLQRLKICLGAARGLQHLHTKTADHPKGIVHRDIKPDNILIDENWVGKISDFGMFKLSQADQATSTMVTKLKGTAGFYAPEYLRYGKVTRKIDVYAFGVVLFLLLCRKMPWDRGDETYIAREDEDLGHWADQNIDNKIREDISEDCLKVFTDIIRRSLRENPNDRPTMDDVVLNLEEALKFQQPREEEDERLQEVFQQPREEEDKGLQEVFRPLDPRSYFPKASDGDSYFHVFLNYDLESLENFGISLHQTLEHAGFRTFIEKWYRNKDSTTEHAEYEAIRNSTCVVLLFGEASFDSGFIEQLRKIMRPSSNSKGSFNFSLLPIYFGESDKLRDRISSFHELGPQYGSYGFLWKAAVRELSEDQPIIFASRDPGDRKIFLDEIVEMIRRKFKSFRINATRFEEKLSNIESENQVLRQQALTMSPTGKSLSARPKTMIIQRTPENGNAHNSEARLAPEMALALSNPREPESEEKPQKSLAEKLVENQDLLIKCISQDLGFSGGKPIAACVIYKCLLHWRSFEVERTTVFDRIIQTIASAIEVQDNNDVLAYWLCNTSTLLMLLQHTLKASGAASMTPQRRRSLSASLIGRMSQGLRGSPQSAGLSFLNRRVLGRLDDLPQLEAKYPALLFKQQLTAFLEKIYGMMRDNLKKEISPLLGLCIPAPRTSRASLVKGRAQTNAVAQQALIAHWQSIEKSLNSYLNTMKANYVPPFLVRKVFTQIFSFINVQLFNSLLLRRESCSFSNGEYVKSGLAELEQWCCFATEEYAGSAWDELKHIRQAVGFLVISQKPKKSLNEITDELCPVLSIQQLYRISVMYWDDKYGTHSVSSEVISSMRVLMTEDSNNAVSSSFLLGDDSSIPFSVDDMSKSMPQVDIDVEPPPLIRENSGFIFLHQRAD